MQVVFYCEDPSRAPVLTWLADLPQKARDKCVDRIQRLEEQGCELHPPYADYLQDGIYELRARFQSVNYRILYCFHGRKLAVLLHGATKERSIKQRDRDKAKKRKERFEADPNGHTWEEDL